MKTKEQVDAELVAIAKRIGEHGTKVVVMGVVMYAIFRRNGEAREEIMTNMVNAADNPGITMEDMVILADAGETLLAEEAEESATRH